VTRLRLVWTLEAFKRFKAATNEAARLGEPNFEIKIGRERYQFFTDDALDMVPVYPENREGSEP
jgi:hypothetical protein